jgi:uncharacterized repeat protein (TIGR03803 family)
MKTSTKNLFLLPVLIAALGLMLARQVTAQTFRTLHSFTPLYKFDPNTNTNSDGATPGGLILSGQTLYGAAQSGGSSGNGTVFAINTDGTGFTNVHNFAGYPTDGARGAALFSASNGLYGAAFVGGSSGRGVLFAINTDGTGLNNLYNFTAANSDGANPISLILSGDTLYGTAQYGGSSGNGTIFAIKTDGTGFTNLHSFAGYPTDGANPNAGMILSGDTLYGTTWAGGTGASGTIFAINTNGSALVVLHNFTQTLNDTNTEGANPAAGLVVSGNTLYGTANRGGIWGRGTVFGLNTDGTGFKDLHTFTNMNGGYSGYGTNSEGAYPIGGLALSGDTLYGTAKYGGNSTWGTVFSVMTDGTGFKMLHTFTFLNNGTNADGINPAATLIFSGTTLYGTASYGGTFDNGTVFGIFLPPQLMIKSDSTNVILTWPTNYSGFTLQSTTNLVSPTVWTTNSPAPVIVDGQNTVTNPISGAQQFYRLSQ